MRSTLDHAWFPTRTPSAVVSDWRDGLPTLMDDAVTLRELQLSDAAPLLCMLTGDDVTRFIAPPPVSVEGFERFIVCANAERQAGRYACFGVIPAGMEMPVGIFQLRPVDTTFTVADWGFAIGSPFWGTGIFTAASDLVLDFAFATLGVHRLEARSVVRNGRGNGALRKLGAVCEGVLRRSLLKNGEYHDQHLWSLLANEWRSHRPGTRVTIN